jgi:hypothetical protein
VEDGGSGLLLGSDNRALGSDNAPYDSYHSIKSKCTKASAQENRNEKPAEISYDQVLKTRNVDESRPAQQKSKASKCRSR